jgi:hypothetical protein
MKPLILFVSSLFFNSCIIIPVSPHVKLGRSEVETSKISFIKIDTTKREDLLLKLGEPDGVALNEKVFIYHWTNVVAWYGVSGGGGVAATGDISREEYFLVGFNEHNTVRKKEIFNHEIIKHKTTLYQFVKDWYEK